MIGLLVLDRRVRAILRLAALGSFAALAVLSVLPGQDRPHTGLPGDAEHALAYALAAAVTRLAFRRTRSRVQWAGFALAAALLETVQIWVPGRSPGVGNWLASGIGALAGIALARALAHHAEREVGRRRRLAAGAGGQG